MGYTVTAEDMLTWALVKHQKGVSISYVRRLSEVAQTKVNNCGFDVEARSLLAVVEGSEIFEWSNNSTIVFASDYVEKIDRIKKTLEYTIPVKINDALANSFL